MGKIGILQKIKMPKKNTAIKWMILILLIIVVVVAAMYMFKGEENVEFKILSEKEIPAQITSQVIPEYRQLERALACVVDDKVYVLASRGEKPTSGYELQIEKMKLSDKNGTNVLTVYTQFKDPQPGTALTQALTYPIQVAETGLSALPDQIELKVQYVE
ncbi:protease complex subunit PrcB family protein [Sinanaerobacter sp. ZZT-01]|uniref:protease complex subunit PrcB family protein n=1 Tax=Sinanaerobacter sp. ZZT-01 TaxID=3111540 RepID=UPI002D79F273|nr:protease complex subunit PrcB family protein [Sinanaerobacter sp. ZZT-01]WRR93497.1 protease complex subunit PrcB family protein [Sinanaerobacter sp. ZZT-01]